MRRRSRAPLPPLPKAGAWPEPKERRTWQGTFPLRVVTPIIGGGVLAMEPDTVDIVRLPEVRGALRWWWRALFEDGRKDAEALFRREAKLWGGVDVPSERVAEESKSHRSRVLLQCRIVDPGRVMPAGRHETGRNGEAKAMPKWTVGQKLGYALFPLQRTQDERRGRASIATRSVRSGVRFELRLEVSPAPLPQSEAQGLEPGEIRRREKAGLDGDVGEVLQALWAWMHFGGLGARTRRGFGALALDGEPDLPQRGAAASLFSADLESGWRQLRQASAEGSRLKGARLYLGETPRDASAAHEEVVGELHLFRQGVGTGREAGPGRSCWPEAGFLRRLQRAGWQSVPRELEGRGAPRAAFGMPLIVQFKGEKEVNASIVSAHGGTGADRWASPVLLRPGAAEGGRWHPLVLLLGGERPRAIRVEPHARQALKPDGSFPVESEVGASGKIEKLLRASHGDALEAFAAWLTRERGFRPAEEGGGR